MKQSTLRSISPAVLGTLSAALFAACTPSKPDDRSGPSMPAPQAETDTGGPSPGRPPAPEEPPPRPDVDEPVVNLSELHYAQVALIGGQSHGVEREPPESPGTVRFLPSPNASPSWISVEGRALSGAVVQLADDTPKFASDQLYPSGLCTTPQPYTGSMTRAFPSGRALQSPLSTFSSETSAVEYLKTVKAKMPFYLPYRHPKVRLAQGWLYDKGSTHRGQDYSRTEVANGEDATFAVRASAAGVVTDVFWTDLSGNIVVIEHTAPSGEKYITYYAHLRNGRNSDLVRALAVSCNGVTDTRCPLYQTFAKNWGGHVSWGTEDQKIAVKPGDTVKAGQFIAWAGNTGYGGAGWGLDANGAPTSSRGNVHLHMYFGAAHPTDPNVYVAVDPYGVYGVVDENGCYDLLKDTAFDRLIAPFYPTFHNVPIQIVERYAGYWTQMGYAPRTLDVHRSSDAVSVSGSFARGIPGAFAAVGFQKLTDYQATVDALLAKGLAPRQTSVTHTALGEPRYSGLFRPLQAGENVERRSSMDQEAWDDRWQVRVLDQEWRVDDYTAYKNNGLVRFSALFTSEAGRPFVFYSKASQPDIKNLIADRAAEGFVPVKVNALENGNTTEFAATLRKLPGCWRVHYALSADAYQSVASLRASKGFRLEYIQAHGDPAKYTAVFSDPDAPATCGW